MLEATDRHQRVDSSPVLRSGGCNLFLESPGPPGVRYLASLGGPGGSRVLALAVAGPPGGLTVAMGGQEAVLWRQGGRGAKARVLRLAHGVDSASEGEEDEEEDEVFEEREVLGQKPSGGFCNCSLM